MSPFLRDFGMLFLNFNFLCKVPDIRQEVSSSTLNSSVNKQKSLISVVVNI
jgi:hypothetical protein